MRGHYLGKPPKIITITLTLPNQNYVLFYFIFWFGEVPQGLGMMAEANNSYQKLLNKIQGGVQNWHHSHLTSSALVHNTIRVPPPPSSGLSSWSRLGHNLSKYTNPRLAKSKKNKKIK